MVYIVQDEIKSRIFHQKESQSAFFGPQFTDHTIPTNNTLFVQDYPLEFAAGTAFPRRGHTQKKAMQMGGHEAEYLVFNGAQVKVRYILTFRKIPSLVQKKDAEKDKDEEDEEDEDHEDMDDDNCDGD